MLERLLENWLDSASERSYQIPFTQMLIDDGYTIIHSTRHSQIEHGKDVIALDAKGNVHAFQLKGILGKKLSKIALRKLLPQLNELAFAKIEHPSINTKNWHQSYLVINGDLEEEASDLLTKTNAGHKEQGYPERQIKTIVRGELLDKAKKLSQRLVPQELGDFKLLLELYLADGKGLIPKDKFANLMSSSLPFLSGDEKKPGNKEFARRITSLALINSIAISSYSNNDNYFAEIEAWIICLSYVFANIEKYSIPEKYWIETIKSIEERIYFLLNNIVLELVDNPKGLEGDVLTESFIYPVRMTLLCSLVSIYSLWNMTRKDSGERDIDFCRKFICDNQKYIQLWGEGAIPQIISLYWYQKKIDATPRPDFFISSILESICKLNARDSKMAIPNPYYDVETIILSSTGNPKHSIEDTFNEHSFTAESLMHLFVRQNWKQRTKLIWPNFTKIMQCSVAFDEPWRLYNWRNMDSGKNLSIWPKRTKNWDELKAEAQECNGENLPELLKKNPALFTLFIIVYPHRCISEAVRWLDSFWKAV